MPDGTGSTSGAGKNVSALSVKVLPCRFYASVAAGVASLSYKGRLPAWLASRLVGQEVCVTFVTIGELARWAEKRHWGTGARTELVDWLGRRVVLPYGERVAWKWGQLSVLAEQRGRPRPDQRHVDRGLPGCRPAAGDAEP